MEVELEKHRLRQEMLLKRNALTLKEKKQYDTWICNKLIDIIQDRNCTVVHCFLPMSSEIDILPLIRFMLQEGIKVITPKTLPRRELVHLELKSLKDLEKGRFGTRHPSQSIKYKSNYDLIIVPGLAFDRENYRLGYGGGYYDNFIIQHPKAHKIGIGYNFQILESIPTEMHDVRLDAILTYNQ